MPGGKLPKHTVTERIADVVDEQVNGLDPAVRTELEQEDLSLVDLVRICASLKLDPSAIYRAADAPAGVVRR